MLYVHIHYLPCALYAPGPGTSEAVGIAIRMFRSTRKTTMMDGRTFRGLEP